MREKMGECHGVCFVSSASPLSHNVSSMNLTTSPDSCMSNEAPEVLECLLRVCFSNWTKCTRRLVLPSGSKRYPRGVLDRSNTRRVSIHCVIRIIIRSMAPLQCRVLQALVLRTERIIGTSIV